MNRQQLLALMILQAAPVFALAATPQPVSLGAPVSDTELSQYRGARDITFNQQNTEGYLYNNQATNTVSGHNQVSGEAFSGMNGFSTVIQNSGNNVIIQSSTIVNVQMQ
ncbi:hypothetical protein [Paracandidimonas lactea]|uniref:hypothetical protein n=1 Tax=Paracandidimonas lactea TaxID=2895524 RepID=UPI001F157CE6|nr:hypothetical protein [Paracandidimonas lactea]